MDYEAVAIAATNSVMPSASRQPGTVRQVLGSCLLVLAGACLVTALLVGIAGNQGLLAGPPGNADDWPAWSPDGKQVAFASNRHGNWDIYVMSADGSYVTELTRDSFARLYFFRNPDDSMPTWSPDGRRLVFVSGRDNGMMAYVDTNLYIMDLDSRHVWRLTYGQSGEAQPAWSPDETRIAYWTFGTMATDPGDVPTGNIYSVPAEPSTKTGATKVRSQASLPAWSPDGSLAFSAPEGGFFQIFVVDPSGHERQLTRFPANSGAPCWSPDGRQIVFVSDRDGGSDLYTMNADGTHVTRLTQDGADYYRPRWAPDGLRIAFASDRDGDLDIYVMDPDGSHLVQLTDEQ